MKIRISNDYIAGFVDGEGCFALKYRADRKFDTQGNLSKVYYYWCAEFVIVLHSLDTGILELIQEKFGVGRISFAKGKEQVRYSVQDTKDLYQVIVSFFDRVQLIGMKGKDYALWSEAVRLIFQHQQKGRIGKAKPMDFVTQKKLQDLKTKVDFHKHRGKWGSEVAI